MLGAKMAQFFSPNCWTSMQNFVEKNKQISARSRWAAACSYVDRRGWRQRHDATFINVSHCRTDRIDAVTSARDLQIRSKRERERERERERVIASFPVHCRHIAAVALLLDRLIISTVSQIIDS